MYDFLFVIVELFWLALTAEALQGKMCQDSLLSGGGRSLGTKVSGEGVVPGKYFLVSTKLYTFAIRQSKLHRAICRRFDTIPACDGQTDGRTDGIAVASTSLAMRELQRGVRI